MSGYDNNTLIDAISKVVETAADAQSFENETTNESEAQVVAAAAQPTTGASTHNKDDDEGEQEQQKPAAKELTPSPAAGSPSKTNKKRKASSNSKQTARKKRTKPKPSDEDAFVLPPAMQERLQAVQATREKHLAAAKAEQEAEIVFQEAQKKLQEAKELHRVLAEQAEKESRAFSKDVTCGGGDGDNDNGGEEKEGSSPWWGMYQKLIQHKEQTGDVNMVRGNTAEQKALRNWVLRQRKRYHSPEGNKIKLPFYLAHKLEEIGFVWNYSEGTWKRHYNELLDFLRIHGHTRVPRGYKANPTLSQWVKHQRFNGNKFQKDPSSVSMTEEQWNLLNDIGFTWDNLLSRSWNERFDELKQFRADYGHCSVPKDCDEYPKLAAWCQNQRAAHRALLSGKRTWMTAERVRDMEELGFVFSAAKDGGHNGSETDLDNGQEEEVGGGDEHTRAVARPSYRTNGDYY